MSVLGYGQGDRISTTCRGITLAGIPLDELALVAAQAESAGFDTIWVSETDHSAIVQATVVATATSRARVGTNIMLAFPRSPAIAAREALDLQNLTDSRFVLGLGSQVRRIVEDHYGSSFDRPAARMAEYIQAVRAVWGMAQGTKATFDGEMYRSTRPPATGLGTGGAGPLPSVHVAAVGPLMTRVAAERSDGILGHPFTSDRYLQNVFLPQIEDAAADAGRARAELEVCQGLIVSIDDNRDAAVAAAKRQIGFYGTTPNYQPVFESYGEAALTATLRDVWKRTAGDPRAIEAAVPTEAVNHYAIAGTAAEVRDRLVEYESLVDHVIVSSPWYGTNALAQRENTEALIEVLGSS